MQVSRAKQEFCSLEMVKEDCAAGTRGLLKGSSDRGVPAAPKPRQRRPALLWVSVQMLALLNCSGHKPLERHKSRMEMNREKRGEHQLPHPQVLFACRP